MPIRINHIALLVDDPEAALRFWRDGLGLKLERTEEVPEQAAAVSFLPIGESHVELVRPTTTDSGLAKYLAKRGPGMHHVCVEVEDIDAVLKQLKEGGFRLIDENARARSDGTRYAFVHPEAASGVLVELYETGKL